MMRFLPSYDPDSEGAHGNDITSVTSVTRVIVWILIIIGVAGAAAVTYWIVSWSLASAPTSKTALGTVPSTTTPDMIAYGTVSTDRRQPIPGAVIHLVIVNSDGKEISRHQIPVGDTGTFAISRSAIPMVTNIAGGMIIAQADSYLTSKANVTLTGSQGGAITISPPRIQLFLQPYNSALALILLLPAVFGLVMALAHLTGYSRGLRVSQTYAIGAACMWAGIVLWLVWLYATRRGSAALIPLFWDDLFISSGVVVFAFVGTMVYVAYSMHEKDAGFFEMSRRNQRRILLTLGGRVLVSPYVAVASYGIFAATFPTLNTGAAAAFFGFFTGLWIKPVLEALNDIGMRFLSAESRQKVVDRLTDQNFDPGPGATSSAVRVRAERAFLDAVAGAREELLRLDGVIGVGAGEKVTDGLTTGRKAIVVYVYKKRDVPPGDASAIPPTYEGYVTDVQTVPPPPADDRCHSVMLDISPEKIFEDKADFGIAESVIVNTAGAVPYLVDPQKTLYFGPEDSDHKKFSMIAAYRQVAAALKDGYDFIAFVLDLDLTRGEGYYYRPIFNGTRGIDFYWEREAPLKVRPLWGSEQLRGAMVFSPSLDMKACLHEIGHAWAAYPRLRGKKSGTSILDSAGQHWSPSFDYADSCMSNQSSAWRDNKDGTFTAVIPSRWMYSPLDRYLMGLASLAELPKLRLLRSLGTTATLLDEIEPSALVAAFGPRSPGAASSTPTFKMAFVAVGITEPSAIALAAAVDAFRPKLERAFEEACTTFDQNGNPMKVLARLSTARL
ncbi:MAG TPA: hypothetical protein VGF28_13375 [Thermoanaerobaculia bacterium]|jgi:hypothetical protein